MENQVLHSHVSALRSLEYIHLQNSHAVTIVPYTYYCILYVIIVFLTYIFGLYHVSSVLL